MFFLISRCLSTEFAKFFKKYFFEGHFQARASEFALFLDVTLNSWNCWGLLSIAEKIKFSIKDFIKKCDKICSTSGFGHIY